jgi:hypothetical protein
MPPSEQSLGGLKCASFVKSYCLQHPLKYVATRYSIRTITRSSFRIGVTLIILPGVSLSKLNDLVDLSQTDHTADAETWIPVIKHLYDLAEQPDSPLMICSAWVIERPNHGEAALLNKQMLAEHYPEVCACTTSFPPRQSADSTWS